MRKKKVLITGIDSFTGIYLRSHLASRGFSIYGTVHSGEGKDGNNFVCDISCKKTVFELVRKIQPDFVVHLAAISYVPYGVDLNVYNVNLFGTLNLLDAIRQCAPNVSKVIIASSAAVYGNHSGIIDEHSALQPCSHYGLSKLAMETMSMVEYQDALPLIIVRPFNYTGRHQSPTFVVPKLIKAFRDKNDEIDLGNIDVLRDFSDVRDIVTAYEIILRSEVVSGTYNICSGTSLSIRDIIRYLQEKSGITLKIKTEKKLLRAKEITSLQGNNKKICALGWMPKFDIESTLCWMLNADEEYLSN